MKLKGTILLSIVALLERFSYYGIRGLLVLYVMDPNTLNISQEQTLSYFGIWTPALVFAAIPFSLITDKYLGQRNSIYVGGIISLSGYLLLIYQNKFALICSLFLILIGTSLVKPSTTILIGRQFDKVNKKRTLAYMIFFMAINIGAFIGVLGIGYISETYDWKIGFLIAGLSTLTYILIVYIFRSQIKEIETNTTSNPNFSITLKKSLLILPLAVFINIVFWKSQDLELSKFIIIFTNSKDQNLFGYEILRSTFQGISAFWSIPLTIIVFVYWSLKGVTNIFKSIRTSLILLIIAILTTSIISKYTTNNLLELSMIPLGVYVLAEIIISPILTSFVTRISDVNYSNTIYSIYILLTHFVGASYIYLFQNEFQSFIVLIILMITISGLIYYQKQISKFTYEIE